MCLSFTFKSKNISPFQSLDGSLFYVSIRMEILSQITLKKKIEYPSEYTSTMILKS